MKKNLFIFFLLILFASIICFNGLCAYAESEEEKQLNQNISDLLDELDLDELQQYLDEHSSTILNDFGDNAREIIEYILNGNLQLDYSSYLNELFSIILNDAISLVPAFSQILAIVILSSIISAISSDGVNGSTKKIVQLACYCLIIVILAALLTGIITQCINCITLIKKQIEIITPILVTLTVLTGGAGSANIYQPTAIFLSSGAVQLISGFIFPVTIGVIVLNLISKLNPQLSFTGVVKFIKSVMKWAIGITVTVFGIFITMQSTATSLFDGILFKATKYVVGSSVPIVGNFLSSGVDMFVSAGLLIKNSVGVCGIILLLAEVIQPIISLLAFSLILKGVGAIAQPLGENTLFSLFSDLASDVEYFLAGLLTVTFMYGLIIMVVVNSAVSFI